jgi:uncharacterized protein
MKHITRKPTHRAHRFAPKLALLSLLSAILWGCATTNVQTDAAQPVDESPLPEAEDLSRLELPDSEMRGQFNHVEQLLASQDWMRATTALSTVDYEALGNNDKAYFQYLQARISYLRGNQASAMAYLETIDDSEIADGITFRLYTFRLFMLELSGDHIESARLASQVREWLPTPLQASWNRKIWRNLQLADKNDLQRVLASSQNPTWAGWVSLALIVRADTRPLQQRLDQWLTEYPEHPGGNPLPGGMQYHQGRTSGKQVAILLPLSGRLAEAGEAVLDGYLAAHYEQGADSGVSDQLLILDLNRFSSANEAYEQAIAEGAEIAIGPLSKAAVTDLATRPALPIPVLALNRIENKLPAQGSAFVQLSLSAEDEADKLAAVAFGNGSRHAAFLRPMGAWGDRAENAVRKKWTALGGKVVSSAIYTNREDHSETVKRSLGLEESEARARNVRDMLATNIEFTARRRQDPDVIFLLSRNGAEARSIKPLLAFHHAGRIPVYSLPNINNGTTDSRNRDLNGIELVEIPWLLGGNPSLRVAIAAGDTGSDQYTRLNALGVDAHLLQSNFYRLQSGSDALLQGSTGLLSLDPDLKIRREPKRARFDGGTAQAK